MIGDDHHGRHPAPLELVHLRQPTDPHAWLRHSDIRLTMNTYTHLQLIDTAGAVEALPSIDAAKNETAREADTGTDGPVAGAGNGATGAEIGAGLQSAGVTYCHFMAKRRLYRRGGRLPNSLRLYTKGNPCHFLSPIVTKPAEGFEPATSALQKRCSTVELRWPDQMSLLQRQGASQRQRRGYPDSTRSKSF